MTGRNTTRNDAVALVATIVAAMILLALSASTATAQVKLGNVKTAVTKAVIPAAAQPSSGGGIRTGSITFDERVLEITAARLDQFMAGLEAESAMAAKVNGQDLEAIDRQNAAAAAAYDKAMDEYNAKKNEFDRCSGSINQDMEKQMAPDLPTEKDRAKLEAMAARIKSAKEAGNMTEVQRLMDSLVAATNPAAQRLTAQANAGTARVSSECGPMPVKPNTPARISPFTWNDVAAAGQKASGMTFEQYQIFRERVAPYVMSQGQSSTMMYTASEVAALKSKSDALGKFGHVFKES